MYQHTLTRKYHLTVNEPFLRYATSTQPVFENYKEVSKEKRPEASNLRDIKSFHFADTIKGFSNLQSNWDSYNADTISQNAINTAINILNFLNNQGFLSSDIIISVFPMRDGGIQFEFDGENVCAELEINKEGESIVIRFDEDGSILGKEQLFELSEISTLLEEVEHA